jgi:hypothetical protein
VGVNFKVIGDKGQRPGDNTNIQAKRSPASAARKQTKKVIALFECPCFLLSGMMPSIRYISFCDGKRRSMPGCFL